MNYRLVLVVETRSKQFTDTNNHRLEFFTFSLRENAPFNFLLSTTPHGKYKRWNGSICFWNFNWLWESLVELQNLSIILSTKCTRHFFTIFFLIQLRYIAYVVQRNMCFVNFAHTVRHKSKLYALIMQIKTRVLFTLQKVANFLIVLKGRRLKNCLLLNMMKYANSVWFLGINAKLILENTFG